MSAKFEKGHDLFWYQGNREKGQQSLLFAMFFLWQGAGQKIQCTAQWEVRDLFITLQSWVLAVVAVASCFWASADHSEKYENNYFFFLEA